MGTLCETLIKNDSNVFLVCWKPQKKCDIKCVGVSSITIIFIAIL